MIKPTINTTDDNIPAQDGSTSSFIGADESEKQLDFDGLFSSQFANITPLYTSPQGPAQLYTATRYGKRFILKGLKDQYRNDPIFTMALVKEFEIGMSLDHPNIRRTVSLETIDGVGKVIVLEYVDGCSLGDLLDAGEITMGAARSIAGQTADALAYLHSKQVFHRDLKPSNILVSYNGNTVKIIDFNLSDSDEFIILKNPAGSQKYMAPEQLQPGARPSAVADIYSFGMVMEELASAAGDEKLAEAVRKCTHQKPARRPQSISLIRLPDLQPSVLQSLSNFVSSKTFTYIMLFVCAVLAVADACMLINAHN
ncbi:MAG: serine/threonine protein kinase [Muribaculaceae bacterium]|nr:serine/threonine protein kinase [Muribaculaceae bacterium]